MAENNVQIGFQGVDEGLSQKIASLAAQLRKTITTEKDFEKALAGVTKEERAQVEAVYKIGQMQQQMASRVALVTQKYKEQEAAAEKSSKTQTLKWTEVYSKIMLVQRAIQLLKKGYDFAKEGAQLDYQAEKFDRMAASVGKTSDVFLKEMKQATQGTLSEFEAMTAAADLLSLGLVKNADDAVRLATVQTGLGMDTGELTLALANQTTRRFDQLGVSLTGFDEKLQALKQSGMDANDAFTEAFLQQAEEQLKRVGNVADGTAGEFKRLEANLKDMTNAAKIAAAEGIIPLVKEINQQFYVQQRTNELIALGVDAQEAYAYALQESNMEEGIATGGKKKLIRANYDEIDSFLAAVDAAGSYDQALMHADETARDLASNTRDLTDTYKGMMGTVFSLQSAHDTYTETIDKEQAKIDELIQKQSEIPQSSEKWQEYQDAIDASNQAIEDAATAADMASNKIIFDLVQMRAAADGVITEDEFAGLLTLGQKMDLIAPDVVEQLFGVQAAADEAADGLEGMADQTFGDMARVRQETSKLAQKILEPGENSETAAITFGESMDSFVQSMYDPRQNLADMNLKLDHLQELSGKTYVYTFEGIMTGDWPDPNDFPTGGNIPCFLGGTPVTLSDGAEKPIENIQVGELVKCYQTETGTVTSTKVEQTFEHEADEYLIINGVMNVTPNHPIYVGTGWVEAGNIQVGDLVFDTNLNPVVVSSIVQVFKKVTVYNLECSGIHNYFAAGILVHNKIPNPDVTGQTGADFIVPPGYGNDSFTVGVTSGERVTVQTPQQQASGQMAGTTINLYAPVTMMVTRETADILDIK